jgi:hypothetical protein
MASRYSEDDDDPDFKRLQRFYRLFRGPGVAHCAGGVGPQPQNLFGALVNWVENDVAPDQILAQNVTGGVVTRTRPLCPYPQTAIFKGGDPNDAASFRCGGNLEKRRVVCADVLTKYKHEVNGRLDFKGTGVDRRECFGKGDRHGHDDDDDDRGHRHWHHDDDD